MLRAARLLPLTRNMTIAAQPTANLKVIDLKVISGALLLSQAFLEAESLCRHHMPLLLCVYSPFVPLQRS